jgi:hypothetical protein
MQDDSVITTKQNKKQLLPHPQVLSLLRSSAAPVMLFKET